MRIDESNRAKTWFVYQEILHITEKMTIRIIFIKKNEKYVICTEMKKECYEKCIIALIY